MKNLKIGKKFLVTFGLIILLLGTVAVMAVLGLNATNGRFTEFYDGPYKVVSKTLDMQRDIQQTAKGIAYATMFYDMANTEKYLQESDDAFHSLESGVAYLHEHFDGDMALVDKLEETLAATEPGRERVYTYARALQNTNTSETYFEKYEPLLLEANDLLSQINEQAGQIASDHYEAAQTNAQYTRLLMIGLSAAALLLTIVLGLYLTRSLKRPIKEIEAAAEQMAAGDLNVSVTYTSKDELGNLSEKVRLLTGTIKSIISDVSYLLGQMAKGNFAVKSETPEIYVGNFESILESMRHINRSLSETLVQINQSADLVTSGAGQVSAGAQALSQGATEQASAVEELAATINEISAQVTRNAENAQQASSKAGKVGSQINESNGQMQKMTAAMGEISQKSAEIGKIIKTIEDIAFQTNILALNAAVEAARAGAAGKGFAVVADEVRNLASKSAEASQNTSILIEGSIKAVENGTKIADETAHTLQSVVAGAQEIVERIDRIAQASQQQADSIVQVTQGVDQISGVVQTNSATAEESAAASEELSGQAAMLKRLVGHFRLREEEDEAAAGGQETPAEPQEEPAPEAAAESKY